MPKLVHDVRLIVYAVRSVRPVAVKAIRATSAFVIKEIGILVDLSVVDLDRLGTLKQRYLAAKQGGLGRSELPWHLLKQGCWLGRQDSVSLIKLLILQKQSRPLNFGYQQLDQHVFGVAAVQSSRRVNELPPKAEASSSEVACATAASAFRGSSERPAKSNCC